MKGIVKILLPLIYLSVLFIPGYTFFVVNHDAAKRIFEGTDTATRFYTLFRLLGLYAFTLLWAQLMLGAFMPLLRTLYGGIALRFHMRQGLFVLLFATLHPLLFYTAYLISGGSHLLFALSEYFGVSFPIFAYMGPVAWTLLVITVTTAYLRNHPVVTKHWRIIHLLNYLVFLFAFLHSFTIGSEVQLNPLHFLYYFYGITFALAFTYRMLYKRLLLHAKK